MSEPETIELKTVLCPIWADADTCGDLFCLSRGFLNKLVLDGDIRKKKLSSESQQSGARYRVADINEWFERGAR